MRYVRYQPPGRSAARLGLLADPGVYDLEPYLGSAIGSGDMRAFLGLPSEQRLEACRRSLEGPTVASVRLRCPLPNPGKLLAVAGGYYPPGSDPLGPDATPYLFCKRTDDIIGPDDPIVLWPFACDVIEEIEIALVIGSAGRDIPVERALDHVAAYTICNDVSARKLAVAPAGRRDNQFDTFIDWLNGKWFDGFAVLGPSLVTPDELPHLTECQITTRVSGQTRVQGDTRDLNFSFAALVSYASRLMTLQPGDVLTTGMPHGNGPEIYLQPGDRVEGAVEGLGTLANPVVTADERVRQA